MTDVTGIQKLHAAIARGRERDGISLMSHCVVGYPTAEENEPTVAALVEAGADLMELQFPFSDPTADGPVLAAANEASVERGTTVDDCFDLARRVSLNHPDTAFVAMTYFNVIFRRGINTFVEQCASSGIAAIIVPDLPPELGDEFKTACAQHGVGTIFLVTPVTSEERMRFVAETATGFVYVVGRPGVSGDSTAFDENMTNFVQQVRTLAEVPVGVGFGIRTAADVATLAPISDMAIVCTEVIRRIDADGVPKAAEYLASLR